MKAHSRKCPLHARSQSRDKEVEPTKVLNIVHQILVPHCGTPRTKQAFYKMSGWNIEACYEMPCMKILYVICKLLIHLNFGVFGVRAYCHRSLFRSLKQLRGTQNSLTNGALIAPHIHKGRWKLCNLHLTLHLWTERPNGAETVASRPHMHTKSHPLVPCCCVVCRDIQLVSKHFEQFLKVLPKVAHTQTANNSADTSHVHVPMA